jgi:hypothetical protein
MINDILRVLNKKGIIDSCDCSEYEYYFNNRANINMTLVKKSKKEPLVFIKISLLRDFENIFHKMAIVHKTYPFVVPEPISFFYLDKYRVLVTKYYNLHLLISSSSIHSDEKEKILRNIINHIIQLHLNTKTDYYTFDKQFIYQYLKPMSDKLLSRWKNQELNEMLNSYFKELKKYYGLCFPAIPQHGDLVTYNIGMIEGRIDKIMFVDWDSYAEIHFPTYDLHIFINSYMNFIGEDMYKKSAFSETINILFAEYCKTIGVDLPFAIDMYPICLLLYSSTKADIGIFAGQLSALMRMQRYFAEKNKFILNINK